MLSLANQARNNIASGSVSPFQAANEMPTMVWKIKKSIFFVYKITN